MNHQKTVSSKINLCVLGYKVSHGIIKADTERMKPLEEMAQPTSKKALERVLGMFAYYSKLIPKFSD